MNYGVYSRDEKFYVGYTEGNGEPKQMSPLYTSKNQAENVMKDIIKNNVVSINSNEQSPYIYIRTENETNKTNNKSNKDIPKPISKSERVNEMILAIATLIDDDKAWVGTVSDLRKILLDRGLSEKYAGKNYNITGVNLRAGEPLLKQFEIELSKHESTKVKPILRLICLFNKEGKDKLDKLIQDYEQQARQKYNSLLREKPKRQQKTKVDSVVKKEPVVVIEPTPITPSQIRVHEEIHRPQPFDKKKLQINIDADVLPKLIKALLTGEMEKNITINIRQWT